MGLGDGQVVFSHTRFGGTGRVYDGFLRCAGNETSLLQCPEPFRPHMSCGHEEDAVVRCGKIVKYKHCSTIYLSMSMRVIASMIFHLSRIMSIEPIVFNLQSEAVFAAAEFRWLLLLVQCCHLTVMCPAIVGTTLMKISRALSQYKDRLIYVWWFPC